MATFTAGTIRDYLKNLSDWILGHHQPQVQLSGSKVTSATTLLDAATVSGSSSWIACAGYNRAILLLEPSADFDGWIEARGRADTSVATLPMYFYNTGIAVVRTGFAGYYELDLNPLAELAVYATVNAGSISVRAWLSATTLVPDIATARLPVFNNVAIRDTHVHLSPVLNGFNQGRGALSVFSSLDQPVTLGIGDMVGVPIRDAAGQPIEIQVSNTGGYSRLYQSGDWQHVLDGPVRFERFTARCDVAPTTGVLYVNYLINP